MASSKPRYFFKVFFPERSTNSLRIPPAFWGQIVAESGRRVALRGPSGSVWKARLVKDSVGFLLEDGWKEFVENQALVMGDFLIFRYKGNSRFDVLVFDKTACEKKEAFLARPSVDNEIEVSEDGEESEEEVSMGDEDDDEEENKPLVHFTKRRFDGNLKRENAINDLLGMNDPSLKKKMKKKYFQFDMDESNSNRSKAYPTNSGDLLSTKQEYDLVINIGFVCAVSKCSPQSTKVRATKKSSKSLDLVISDESTRPRGSIYRMGSLISQRRPVTEEEVEKTHQRAMSFKSEHPFAVAIMQDSYVYNSFYMNVPSWFAKVHLPRENTVLTVWDPTGKPWKITYICYGSRGVLSGGWGKFSFAHNLEKYDVCVFELIKASNLKVHIYRVVEEITPLIRCRCATNKFI